MTTNNPDLFGDVIDVETVHKDSSLPLQVAQHVLWHFGDEHLGLQPGEFTTRLLLTISAADKTNRDKLAVAFPDYVLAYRAVGNEPWGLDWLRKIAREQG